jgi:hypothetical protein
MPVAVQNTALTNSVTFLVDRVNELANAMSTVVVTAGATSTANGDSAISGNLSANGVVANVGVFSTSVRVGANTLLASDTITLGNSVANSVLSSSSLTLSNSTVGFELSIPTAAQVANGQYFMNSNGSWVASAASVLFYGNVQTTGNLSQLVDSWSMTSFRVADYVLAVHDNVSNNKYASHLTTTHDGTSAYSTEYAQLTTNTSVGVFSVSTLSGNLALYFTPVSSNATVYYVRTLL